MADRTSASLFGKIFELLAQNPSEEHKKIAKEIWPFTMDYDFNEYQMECDDSLIALDLAKYGEEDGNQVILYLNYKGEFK